MATSTQSSTPVTFMPRLRKLLATQLDIPEDVIRLGSKIAGIQKPHSIEDSGLYLMLSNPASVNPNAGAGRRGHPLTRLLLVTVRTRGGVDMAGGDEAALQDHWTLQDKVINALLVLPHTAENATGIVDDDRMPFIRPIEYLGEQSQVERVKNSGSALESVLPFRITYVPEVTI